MTERGYDCVLTVITNNYRDLPPFFVTASGYAAPPLCAVGTPTGKYTVFHDGE